MVKRTYTSGNPEHRGNYPKKWIRIETNEIPSLKEAYPGARFPHYHEEVFEEYKKMFDTFNKEDKQKFYNKVRMGFTPEESISMIYMNKKNESFQHPRKRL